MPRPVILAWLVFAQSIISTRFAPSCGAVLCSGHARTPPRKNGRPARPTSLEEEARRHGQLRGAKRRYRIMSLLCLFRRSGRSYPYNRCSSSCGAVFLRSGHARDPPLKAAGAARPPSKPAVGLRPFRPAPRGPPPRPALGKSGRIVSCLARTGRLWGIRGKECIRGGYPPGWPPST